MGAALADASQAVLLDMEASVEHMRRATVQHIDTLLVVTEPYYRSLEAAGRLIRLAAETPVKRIFGVANKVRSPSEENAIRSYLEERDIPVLAVVPFDENVGEADQDARPIFDFCRDAPAVVAIGELAEKILR